MASKPDDGTWCTLTRVALVFATLIVGSGAHLASQTRPPVTYSAEVTLVEVDAVVTDAEGHVVRDLRKEDFQIFENEKPQTIDRLSFVDIPIQRVGRATPSPVPANGARPDVRTNLQRFDGRLYVLLLDDVQTSAVRAVRVKTAARRFVTENLEAGDLAAVVHVSAARGANQDFTSSQQLLLASIDRFQGRKVRSETLNMVDEYNRQLSLSDRPNPKPLRDADEDARANDARRAFDMITAIGRRLDSVRSRRKALLWFGEGVAYDMFDTSRSQASFVVESARAAVAATTRANLVIYGVDARGLAGLGDEALQLSRVAQDPASKLGVSGLQQELRTSQNHLQTISVDTGGFAVTNTDRLSEAFERVVSENSAYYLLGYYPADADGHGTYRRIDVKVKRPGLTIRARAGYVPSRIAASGSDLTPPAASAELVRNVLDNPVPQSNLPMATHAAAFMGTRDKASVLVTVEYGASAFEVLAPHQSSGDRLDATAIAVDTSGKVVSSDHVSIALDVKPETQQAMLVLGFRTHSRLELSPGRYQLRAAGILTNGLIGSVHHDIEVPDFQSDRRGTPVLSDLVLTSNVARLVPTARPDGRMQQVLPAPPTAMRDFRQDESIALFVEAYEGGSVPSHGLTFSTTVRGSGNHVAFARTDTRTPDELKQSKGGYTLQVPLRAFAPGEYSLRLEASIANANSSAIREIAFRVWTVPPQTSDPATERVVVVAHGAVSGVAEPQQAVARNPDELQALWSSLPLRTPVPQVAFTNTMIVAVFLGTRPTAGHEPEVVAVRRDGATLIVSWRERTPKDPGNPPAETTPFAIVGVARHDGPVRFERVP